MLALAQLVDQAQLASLVQLVVEAKDDERAQAAEDPFHFADAGAQMLVYDVNGDGFPAVLCWFRA